MRLVTFNILHGRAPADDLVRPDDLEDAVRQLNPDILALQEVDRDQPRSARADLTAVAAAAMGAVSYRFLAALSGTPGATWMAATGAEQPGTASFGISLLSRYPAAAWQAIRLPRIPVRFPCYLSGPRKVIVVQEEPRCVLVGYFDTPQGRLTVANTHLTFVPGWRKAQLRLVVKDLANLPGTVLLMGDLNMAPPLPRWASGYRSLANELTFPVNEPTSQLDYVLARGALGPVASSEAVALKISDHRALVVDLAAQRA